MVSLEAPAIIRTPSLGDRAAKFMCEKMKIANQYDSKKLAEAKLEVYKQGMRRCTVSSFRLTSLHSIRILRGYNARWHVCWTAR